MSTLPNVFITNETKSYIYIYIVFRFTSKNHNSLFHPYRNHLQVVSNFENIGLFGLSSNKSPPSIPLLKPFEDDLIKLIENVKFRCSKDQFQTSLANDLKKINSSPNIFIFADKTRNIYETPLNTYNELLHDNITKTYKHGSEDFIEQIDSELKEISSRLGIGDRIERMKKREAFISLKDHKENFVNNPKCRLNNAAKSGESGKLSKVILKSIPI